MHLCSSRKLSLQILETDLSFSYVPEPVVSLIALNLWENVMPPDSCSCTSPRLRNQEGSRGPGLGQAWYLLCTSCTHKVLSLAGRFISFNSFICKYERRSQGKAEWEESFCIFSPPSVYISASFLSFTCAGLDGKTPWNQLYMLTRSSLKNLFEISLGPYYPDLIKSKRS